MTRNIIIFWDATTCSLEDR